MVNQPLFIIFKKEISTAAPPISRWSSAMGQWKFCIIAYYASSLYKFCSCTLLMFNGARTHVYEHFLPFLSTYSLCTTFFSVFIDLLALLLVLVCMLFFLPIGLRILLTHLNTSQHIFQFQSVQLWVFVLLHNFVVWLQCLEDDKFLRIILFVITRLCGYK